MARPAGGVSPAKNPACAKTIAELKKEGLLPKGSQHRPVKYLNNRLEGDHRKLKRLIKSTLGFQSMKTAYATIKGFEVMRMFRKGQFTTTGEVQGMVAMEEVCRRDILVLAVGWTTFRLLTFLPINAADTQVAESEPIRFRWRVPTSHYQTVENTLIFDGSIEEERDTKGLPLVFVFVGVALLPSLVDSILTLRRKLVQPGLRIDARGAEIKIDVDPTLPRGTILLCDKTGCKLNEPDQLIAPAEFAKALTGAMSK